MQLLRTRSTFFIWMLEHIQKGSQFFFSKLHTELFGSLHVYAHILLKKLTLHTLSLKVNKMSSSRNIQCS